MAKDLGDQLRHAREEKGLTLEYLMARTKIPVSALRALEDEAFDRLPPGVFRRAYLRAFAGEVGLNADECVQWYADHWEPPPPPEPEPRLSSWTDDRLRALLVGVIVVGVIAATPLIRMLWRIGGNDGPPRAATAAARPPAPVVDTAVVRVSTPPPIVPVASSQPLQLQIRVTDRCWISATADDEKAVRRLFRAGETLNLNATKAIVLYLGDAGAVTHTINGERGRAFGKRGELVTARITPQTYATFVER